MPRQSKVLSVIAPNGVEFIANDHVQFNSYMHVYNDLHMDRVIFSKIIEHFSSVHWKGHAITVILTPENSSLNADKPLTFPENTTASEIRMRCLEACAHESSLFEAPIGGCRCH